MSTHVNAKTKQALLEGLLALVHRNGTVDRQSAIRAIRDYGLTYEQANAVVNAAKKDMRFYFDGVEFHEARFA